MTAGPAAAIPVRISALFGSTILTGASLLFLVQPLESKLILPWFGGSAAVWTTCMLFFQAGLLLGYLYAHNLVQRISSWKQPWIHSILLLGSVAALPILPNPSWQPRPGEDPAWRVFGVLAASLGLPYLLLSSTSPLLQAWYARARLGSLPYRYFALSNAGSLAALLAYPILIEPRLTGHQQAWLWSAAYVCFAVLCAGAAIASVRANAIGPTPEGVYADQSKPQAKNIVLWISLAASASALLLVVTNLLTQNVAPMPILWVVPLSLYLLTFILCFESNRWYRRYIFLPLLLPSLGCMAACAGPLKNREIALIIPLLTGALFISCMACHGELARLRPATNQLTRFYLCLSCGGAIGGVFVALIAPRLFSSTYENSIAFTFCPVVLLVVLGFEQRSWTRPSAGTSLWLTGLAGTLLLAGYTSRETWRDVGNARENARNFYGALRVQDSRNKSGQMERSLTHGTITHGTQFLDENLRRQPTTYYAWDSGIGLTWRSLAPGSRLRMGVIGLGSGTLATFGRSGDLIRFYEINPLVVRIATTEFSYLSDCRARHDVALGDARLSLSREQDQNFDILVVDAFSGDSIPVHLLTQQAFELYFRHLKPSGVLAVHVSNRYINLAPVVALAGRALKKECWMVNNEDDEQMDTYASSYVLVSSLSGFFTSPLLKGETESVDVPRALRPWTDDFSNLWQVLKFRK